MAGEANQMQQTNQQQRETSQMQQTNQQQPETNQEEQSLILVGLEDGSLQLLDGQTLTVLSSVVAHATTVQTVSVPSLGFFSDEIFGYEGQMFKMN